MVKVLGKCEELGRHALRLYIWLVAITGVRRGELCALQLRDIDLEHGVIHIAYNSVVGRGGNGLRKDTKTHQERDVAIDPVTCGMVKAYIAETTTALTAIGLALADVTYLFSLDPMHAEPWNPDTVTRWVGEVAKAAGVDLNIKGVRYYTASQMLAAGFDLGNTAARLGHGSGGATTLKHYADPVSEIDRRAAAYLAKLTSADSK